MKERAKWNELYKRAVEGAARPPGEIESVPLPLSWGEQPLTEWRAQEFLIPHLRRTRRWLDLGCGTGSVLAAFLRLVPHATAAGIDASDVALESGRRCLESDVALRRRMQILRCDVRACSSNELGRFDLVYALYSLQFLRLQEFFDLVAGLGRELLEPGGCFAGTVRSVSRSVPRSYVLVEGEPNTFVSHEPHEAGLVYHHYTAEELQEAARILGGDVSHLVEKGNVRDYDPASKRAWWDFVIERPGNTRRWSPASADRQR